MIPILIGPGNALAATGLPWRRVRDHAAALGVASVRVGRATLIPAAALMAAIDAQIVRPTDHAITDPTADLRRRLGLVRRSA